MKTKILLADDEADLEDIFRQRFRRQILDQTYQFIFVRNGLEALAVLEQQPDIDVLLSDINMPGMDGLTLLAKLPAINPVLRTVIITAYGDMGNIRTAMNQGAFDFLTKPLNFRDLEMTLEKTIQSATQHRQTMELKEMDAMKTRFFSNITHEFRTPLSLIVSPVDKLLQTADLPPVAQQFLHTIQRNARQLLRLINQLLDVNKLEAGQMELVNEVGDLPGFVGQLVDLFRPSAIIKQLTLTYQTDLPHGNYLFDARKWETILYNLLSNAVKFTETGQITVTLTCTPAAAQLMVSDTGIGIPSERLVHIFDRFYQVDLSRTRAYEGTGIGLALVRELTQRLGGSITVQSQVNSDEGASGTQFQLEIPLPAAELSTRTDSTLMPHIPADWLPQPDQQIKGNSISQSAHTPLVLVVEDNAELREFIVAELATNYRIRSAANGYEGWVVAKEYLPDVIVSDVMMPRMDGYELLQRVRNDPATDHIAVVLLTASIEPSNQQKGLLYGADDYLSKPFSLVELQLRLRNLINRQVKLRESYRQQLAQPEAAPLEKVQDQFLRRLYGLLEARLDDSTLSVEWLAGELSMSRRSLYAKVHSVLQLSPHEVIRQYRLGKALALLRSGRTASETAYEVGFESPSYFTKVFKEFYGQTPSDYMR